MVDSYITLRGMVLEISDQKLQKLVLYFLDNPGFKEAVCSPYHHTYNGGLSDHVLEVTQMSLGIYDSCVKKDLLSRDFLIAGAMLHDVGKLYMDIEEYRNAGVSHAIIGAHVVSEACRTLNIPDETRKLLMSLIVEHSKYGLGKHVKFSTREAYIVLTADGLSAAVCSTDNTSEEAKALWDEIQVVNI